MMNKNVTCKKVMIEKYEIRINSDYAIFTLDKLEGYGWRFNCQSSWGNYSHIWSSPGSSFKQFLIRLKDERSYLFDKLCKAESFYPDMYIKDCKKLILDERQNRWDGLTKQQARSLWRFFDEEINCDSFDLIIEQLYGNETLRNSYGDEIFNTGFMPDKTYSFDHKHFIEKVYPIFVDILKNELKDELKAI